MRTGQQGRCLAYCATLLENDPKLAINLIDYAEQLMLDRLADLRLHPGWNDREAQDLNTALAHLGVLQEQIEDAERFLWD